MRIFKMEKEKEEQVLNDVMELKMKDNKNKIDIINPEDSNSIYIINDMFVKNAKENNEVKIYGCSFNEGINENSIDDECIEDKYRMLFYNTSINKEKVNNILEKNYFIILPGASLVIEFINYDKDLALRLHSYREKI
ncbi:MAG: hypothetical protein ACRCW0_03465 [Clostridium sp.]